MDRSAHILVVDDDKEIRALLSKFLAKNGLRVSVAADGREMRRVLDEANIDLIVLDLMLPGDSGLTLCGQLRATTTIPILMLTAIAEDTDRIIGLEMGADDYLAKPFDISELDARVKALLRRSQGNPASQISCGALTFDTVNRVFTCNGETLNLTRREHAVLEALMVRAGKAVRKERLFEQVFTLEDESTPEVIETYVHRVRRKLEGTGAEIVTLRGLGYMLKAQNG